jgi:surfeit locus 1 family protein
LNSTVRAPRSTGTRIGLAVTAVLLFCVFTMLGTWQVQRRTWKLDLIARVDQRVHAPPVPPPPPAEWPQVTAANSEYRHVRVTGTFLNESETLVQALTELGTGYWVLTPLQLADGTVLIVNRGFVPPERRDRAAHEAGAATTGATVTGLLRISEPKGSFLRRNDPVKGLWYSRDVEAIAAARGLSRVAPYFVDEEAGEGDGQRVADASVGTDGGVVGANRTAVGSDGELVAANGRQAAAQAPTSAPVGGLTVIAFRNTHLTYAITWFGLALMVLVGAWIFIREERRRA